LSDSFFERFGFQWAVALDPDPLLSLLTVQSITWSEHSNVRGLVASFVAICDV